MAFCRVRSDQVEYCLAFLFAQCIAEDTSQQADIFPQRGLFVGYSWILAWSIHVEYFCRGFVARHQRRAVKLDCGCGPYATKQTLRPPIQGILFPGNSMC